MNKFQQGGQIPQDIQIVAQVILVMAQQQGQQVQPQEAVQQAAQLKQSNPDAFNEALQAGTQMLQQAQQQQVQAAKKGAKLNYIRSLNNQCPEGMELQYFKAGGQICSKCVEAKKKAEKASCGTKVEKKCSGGISKAMEGIRIELAKCGNKIKKAENGDTTKKYKTETARNLTRTISTTKDPNTGKVKSDTTIMDTGTLATYDSNSSGKRREYYEKANHNFEVLSGKNKKDATKSLTPKPILKKCGGKTPKNK